MLRYHCIRGIEEEEEVKKERKKYPWTQLWPDLSPFPPTQDCLHQSLKKKKKEGEKREETTNSDEFKENVGEDRI